MNKTTQNLLRTVLITLIGASVLVPALVLLVLMKTQLTRIYQRESMAASRGDSRAITRAFLAYAEKHNDRLPESVNWEASVRPYAGVDENTWKKMMSPQTFPGGPNRRFIMNQALSGKKASRVKDADGVILIYEGETASGENAADDLTSFPPCTDKGSVATVVGFLSGWCDTIPCADRQPFSNRDTVVSRSKKALENP